MHQNLSFSHSREFGVGPGGGCHWEGDARVAASHPIRQCIVRANAPRTAATVRGGGDRRGRLASTAPDLAHPGHRSPGRSGAQKIPSLLVQAAHTHRSSSRSVPYRAIALPRP